jgi:threonine/homoserine/homoserine lactone efflux protein
MTTAELTALLVLCTATSFTPGPNTTLSTALAANLGLRRALRFVLSVPVGWGLLFSLCAAGVGALVLAVPVLRLAVQVGGIGYLLWLALKLWRANTLAQADAGRLQVTFWQGVMLQFLNIKAWMLALTVVAGWLAGRDGRAEPLCSGFADAAGLWPVQQPLTYALMGTLLRQLAG